MNLILPNFQGVSIYGSPRQAPDQSETGSLELENLVSAVITLPRRLTQRGSVASNSPISETFHMGVTRYSENAGILTSTEGVFSAGLWNIRGSIIFESNFANAALALAELQVQGLEATFDIFQWDNRNGFSTSPPLVVNIDSMFAIHQPNWTVVSILPTTGVAQKAQLSMALTFHRLI